jgi:glutamyl-tRNA reductase
MSIVVIGVNHRTAPLAVLERLAVAPDDVAKSVAGLAQRDTIREVVVLSTCGRTEVYLVAERFHGAYADVTEFLATLAGMPLDELHPHLLALHDDAAATHLFEVTAGLDSFVLGESEILGQVRAAWQSAVASGGVGATLDLLFRHALRTGKRARAETAIGRGTSSISHAAVELAAEHFGSLAGHRALVVGAGEMGTGVASSLSKAGATTITIANRTADRGRTLAATVAGGTIAFDALDEALEGTDLVITCVAGTEGLITAEQVATRKGRGLLIVDIALPRNVDRGVAAVDGVTLLDLDDVRAWAQRGRAARAAETARVREIIADQLERFLIDSTARQAAPLVARLHEHAEQIRAAELRRYANRLAGLSADDDEVVEVVEALTRAIVAKLLHQPSVRLRHDAGTPRGERNAAAVGDLFDLGSH